jgi:hypothetical protein
LFVLFFIAHDRRELVHCRVAAHPTAAWGWRQLIEATSWDRQPRYLVRDRDAVYGRDFPGRAQARGIRTLRTECLDHVLVLHARHLEVVLQEYATHDNRARPHRSLGLGPPVPGARAARPPGSAAGRIIARPLLGGLRHVYERAA